MNVSSYLEAFLSVYGWETYYTIYLALSVSGLFLYPLCRAVLEQYIEHQSSSQSDQGYASNYPMRSILVNIIAMMLIFVTALVPMVPISFDKTVVKTVCESADIGVNQFNENSGKTYFSTTSTRVPMFPWVAMSIGQGLNAVIYNQTPCVLDLTETQKSMLDADLHNAENPAELQAEKSRYLRECQTKINRLIDELNGEKTYSEATNKWFKDKVREISKEQRSWWEDLFRTDKLQDYEVLQILKSPDSELIKRYFFSQNVPEELKPVVLGLNAEGAVEGVTGLSNGNDFQGNATPPSCADWWRGQGDGGLRGRLVKGLSDDVMYKVMISSNHTGPKECRMTPNGVYGYTSLGTPASCRKAIIDKIAKGDEDNFTRKLLFSIQGAPVRDSVLTEGDGGALTLAISGAISASILSKFVGVDLSGGIIGSITSFYGMMFILKLLLRYLVPLAEMAVFMFWGIYMVLGGLSGRALIKGMMLIIALTIIPSLWAVVSHLDDQLWEAMYGTTGVLDPFNMILLDTASTIFQFAIIYVLFYIVSLAGGGDASGALGRSDSHASTYARNIGNTGGSVVGNSGSALTQGSFKGLGGRVSRFFRGQAGK